METKLRVTAVQVRDVLGARAFSMEPGRVTVLRGRNASGKSSALKAVQAALGGGNLATMARIAAAGEEVEPEVVLVLEGDGLEAYRVERKGSKVRVRERVGDTAAFQDVPRPQAWLTGLFDPRGSNPVAFLTAPDKERGLMLLEALPVQLDRAALWQAIGLEPGDVGPVPAADSLHPFDELALLREAIFRERTGVNRDQKAKVAAGEQTRLAMPAVIPEGGEDAITRLAAQIEERQEQVAVERQQVAAEHDKVEAKIQSEFRERVRSARAGYEAEAARQRAEVEARLSALKESVETQVAAWRTADEAIMEQNDRAQSERLDAVSRLGDELGEWRVRLAAMRERGKAVERAKALEEQAARFDAEAAELVSRAERLTYALWALDEFRMRLLENLPIKGLGLSDEGRVLVDDVPFGQVNTSRQVAVAVQVACLRAKACRLPAVFVDGAEALDSEAFALLVEQLKAAEVQAFICRVDDEALKVEVRT